MKGAQAVLRFTLLFSGGPRLRHKTNVRPLQRYPHTYSRCPFSATCCCACLRSLPHAVTQAITGQASYGGQAYFDACFPWRRVPHSNSWLHLANASLGSVLIVCFLLPVLLLVASLATPLICSICGRASSAKSSTLSAIWGLICLALGP